MQVYRILPTDLNIIRVRNTLAAYNGLSVNTRDLGTLCQKATSKWSKYKPVRLDNSGHPTDWWKAKDGNCGLEVPIYFDISEVFTALRAGTPIWNYQTPRGSASAEPFRLLDFAEYDALATPPLMIGDLNSTYFVSNGNIGTSMDFRNPTPYELALSDISGSLNLGNFYFGVAVSKPGTSSYKYITEANTITGGGSMQLNIPITLQDLGSCEIIFMLVEDAKTSFDLANQRSRFVPIDGGYKIVNIESSSANVSVFASWALSQTNWTVEVVNFGSSTLNLTDCQLSVRYKYDEFGAEKNYYTPEETGERTFAIGNSGVISVAANSTLLLEGTVINSLPSFASRGGQGKIYFRCSNSVYYRDGDFEQEAP